MLFKKKLLPRLVAWRLRVPERRGQGLFYLVQRKVDVSGVRQTFIICDESAIRTRRYRLRHTPTRGPPGIPLTSA